MSVDSITQFSYLVYCFTYFIEYYKKRYSIKSICELWRLKSDQCPQGWFNYLFSSSLEEVFNKNQSLRKKIDRNHFGVNLKNTKLSYISNWFPHLLQEINRNKRKLIWKIRSKETGCFAVSIKIIKCLYSLFESVALFSIIMILFIDFKIGSFALRNHCFQVFK